MVQVWAQNDVYVYYASPVRVEFDHSSVTYDNPLKN